MVGRQIKRIRFQAFSEHILRFRLAYRADYFGLAYRAHYLRLALLS